MMIDDHDDVEDDAIDGAIDGAIDEFINCRAMGTGFGRLTCSAPDGRGVPNPPARGVSTGAGRCGVSDIHVYIPRSSPATRSGGGWSIWLCAESNARTASAGGSRARRAVLCARRVLFGGVSGGSTPTSRALRLPLMPPAEPPVSCLRRARGLTHCPLSASIEAIETPATYDRGS